MRVDESDRDLAVYPDGRVVDVEVTVTPTEGGATVAIDPRFVAVYRDASAFAGTRRRACNSFGVFETRFVKRCAPAAQRSAEGSPGPQEDVALLAGGELQGTVIA